MKNSIIDLKVGLILNGIDYMNFTNPNSKSFVFIIVTKYELFY